MLMFSITKPKKKIKGLCIGLFFILTLGVGVPMAYGALSEADAMASFAEIFRPDEALYVTDTIDGDLNTAEIEINNVTGDPIKVNAGEDEGDDKSAEEPETKAAEGNDKGFFEKIFEVIFGAEKEIIYYNVE